ncbi:MAG: hypothetical protein M3R24_23420 [Chloroflexota bacterium]|nr:hypothetical protein [Chloroflexota bacterium]
MAKLAQMLTAYGPEEQRVTAGEIEEHVLRLWSQTRQLSCPNPTCCHPLIYRNGPINATHFAHYPGAECSDPFGEPDGPEHRAMKRAMRSWLRERLQRLVPIIVVEMEEPVPKTGQRADMMATWQNGQRIGIEVQHAPITGAEWLRRHHLYQQAGIVDI